MTYPMTTWTNSSGQPISAANLNKIEQGIADAHTLATSEGSVDTITALKAISLASVSAGDVWFVSGYDVAGDGCGGAFIWDTTAPKTVSSVDTTTNTITFSANHGYKPGQKIKLYASGSMLGGVTSGQACYVAKDGLTNTAVRLGTTYQNAISIPSTVIDITSAGSGVVANVAEDGGTIFEATTNSTPSTGRWIRAIQGQQWSVAWFGVRNNWGTDYAPRAQNALLARGVVGGAIYWPPGDYYLDVTSSTITQPTNVYIKGDNLHAPNLQSGGNNVVFTSIGNYLTNGANQSEGRGWENLIIQPADSAAQTGASAGGILTGDGRNIMLRNVRVVSYNGGTNIEFRNVAPDATTLGTEGTQLDGVVTSGGLRNIAFRRQSSALSISSFSDLRMNGCYIGSDEVTNGRGIYIENASIIYAAKLEFKLQHSGSGTGWVGIYLDGAGTPTSSDGNRASIQMSDINVAFESKTPNPGTLIRLAAYDVCFGTGAMWNTSAAGVFTVPSTAFYQVGKPSPSQDRGNASVTLVTGLDFYIQRFNTALTAIRTVTLPASGFLQPGDTYTVLREASATGAFNLNVNNAAGSTIVSLTAASQWVSVTYDGATWRVSAKGVLT